MRFIFADSITKLGSYTDKGWLYFFLTRLQPNSRQAFVKFGLTEQALIDRLDDYTSLNLANIYAIRIPCEEVFIREGAMKQIFRICKENNDVNIWKDYGVEYLKGDLDLMLRIFLYFCTSSLDEARSYKFKKSIIENENLLSWINSLPTIDKYNINRLSSWKEHKMDHEVDNILDVTEDMNDNKLEITPIVVTIKSKDCDIKTEKYICNKCGKKCKDGRGLTIHYNKCDTNKHFECEFCSQEFCSSHSLSMHITRCKLMKSNKELSRKEEIDNLKLEVSNLLISQKEYDRLMILKEEEILYLKEQLENIQSIHQNELFELKEKFKISDCHNKDKEIQELKEINKTLISDNSNLISFISKSTKKTKRNN